MRLILAGTVLFITWKWGDWRNWKRYIATILFLSLGIGNILNDYLSYKHFMFDIPLFGIPTHTMVVLIDRFIAFPCTVLLYLPYFPYRSRLSDKVLYIIMWTGIYNLIELFFLKVGGVSYHHGWNFWLSALVDLFTFIVLPIHFRKPLVAYGLSIIAIPALLVIFHVPISPTAWI